jgi:hypothetical protein
MEAVYDAHAEREQERPAAPEREFRGKDDARAATDRRAVLEAAYDRSYGAEE